MDSLKPGAPLKSVGAPFYIRLRDFLQNCLATLRSMCHAPSENTLPNTEFAHIVRVSVISTEEFVSQSLHILSFFYYAWVAGNKTICI